VIDPEPPRGLSRIFTSLEFVPRIGGVVLVGLYGTGFLIVSLHHAAFGISEFDFVKPRIFSAGVLFLLLTAVPIVAASRIFPIFRVSEADRQRTTMYWRMTRALGFAPTCVGLAFFARILLFEPVWDPDFHKMIPVFAALAFSVFVFAAIRRSGKTRPIRSGILCGLACLLVAIGLGLGGDDSYSLAVGWFFGVGTVANTLSEKTRGAEAMKNIEWEMWTFYLLSYLSLYSVLVYGRVTQRFGGGAPITIVIYTTKTVPLFESQPERLFMVDENDRGLYLLRTRDSHHAIFLPRSLIEEVYFGDNLSEIKRR